MLRRKLSVMLLVVVAVQLLGAMSYASVCVEPCPDETEEASCPPVCALCTTCAHAQKATLQQSVSAAPPATVQPAIAPRLLSTSARLASDIFHVPLRG